MLINIILGGALTWNLTKNTVYLHFDQFSYLENSVLYIFNAVI